MPTLTDAFEPLVRQFGNTPITWRVVSESLDTFQESESEKYTDYELTGLLIPNKNESVFKDAQGSEDMTGGYVLFHMNVLKESGLAVGNDNELLMNPNSDFFFVKGKMNQRYEVLSVQKVAPDKDTVDYILVKVFYRKELK